MWVYLCNKNNLHHHSLQPQINSTSTNIKPCYAWLVDNIVVFLWAVAQYFLVLFVSKTSSRVYREPLWGPPQGPP